MPYSPDDESSRLRITHLLAWTAATAVWLGVLQAQFAMTHRPRDIVMASLVAVAPIEGALLAGFLLFIYRWRCGRGFARHPGDWLLVANGADLAVTVLTRLHSIAILAGWSRPHLSVLAGAAPMAAQILLYYVASSRLKDSRLWRGVFRLLAALAAFGLAYKLIVQLGLTFLGYSIAFHNWLASMSIFAVGYVPAIAAAGIVGYAAVVDRKAGIRRPWTHWVGIAAVIAWGALSTIGLAAWMLGYQ